MILTAEKITIDGNDITKVTRGSLRRAFATWAGYVVTEQFMKISPMAMMPHSEDAKTLCGGPYL